MVYFLKENKINIYSILCKPSNQNCCRSKWIASFEGVRVSFVISVAQAETNLTARQSATHLLINGVQPWSMGADKFVVLSGIGSCLSKGAIS